MHQHWCLMHLFEIIIIYKLLLLLFLMSFSISFDTSIIIFFIIRQQVCSSWRRVDGKLPSYMPSMLCPKLTTTPLILSLTTPCSDGSSWALKTYPTEQVRHPHSFHQFYFCPTPALLINQMQLSPMNDYFQVSPTLMRCCTFSPSRVVWKTSNWWWRTVWWSFGLILPSTGEKDVCVCVYVCVCMSTASKNTAMTNTSPLNTRTHTHTHATLINTFPSFQRPHTKERVRLARTWHP